MKICNKEVREEPVRPRSLVFRDLQPGDVFHFVDCSGVLRVRNIGDHWTSLTTGFLYTKGPGTDTEDRPIVLYPDACLAPGQPRDVL